MTPSPASPGSLIVLRVCSNPPVKCLCPCKPQVRPRTAVRAPCTQHSCSECLMAVQACAEAPPSPCAAAAASCLCALVNVGLTLLILINLERSAWCDPRGAEKRAVSCPGPDISWSLRFPPPWCHWAAAATTRAPVSPAQAVNALLPTTSVCCQEDGPAQTAAGLSLLCPARLQLFAERAPLPFWGVQSNVSVPSSHSHPTLSLVHGCHPAQTLACWEHAVPKPWGSG